MFIIDIARIAVRCRHPETNGTAEKQAIGADGSRETGHRTKAAMCPSEPVEATAVQGMCTGSQVLACRDRRKRTECDLLQQASHFNIRARTTIIPAGR